MENPKSEITKIVTTTRDQPLNVQLIKAAQRSTIELQKLADLDPLPPPEISRAAPHHPGMAHDAP